MLMRPFEARISNSLRRTKGVALHKKKACRGCIRFSPQLPEKMNLDERLIPFLHRVTGHSATAACSVTTACLVLSRYNVLSCDATFLPAVSRIRKLLRSHFCCWQQSSSRGCGENLILQSDRCTRFALTVLSISSSFEKEA